MVGRAASINWIDRNVPGILACWHGGEKVGQAVAESLFGDTNPGGKLPITFPQTVGQIPLAVPHRNGAWGAQNQAADPNGWGSTRIVDPLYPFGYGLSYTTFDYGGLNIEPAEPTAGDTIDHLLRHHQYRATGRATRSSSSTSRMWSHPSPPSNRCCADSNASR